MKLECETFEQKKSQKQSTAVKSAQWMGKDLSNRSFDAQRNDW